MQSHAYPITAMRLAALVLGLVLFSGSARAETAPYKLRLPGPISYELNLPSLVAVANGYFNEEGIEFSEYVAGSGGTLRAAMIAGEFDFGLFAFVHAPLAIIAGSPWKAVVGIYNQEIVSLIVRSELKDQVKTVADLRGRKVGYSLPGTGSWYLGSLFLKKAGLDPEKDVENVFLGGDPGVIYAALKTGKVDAFSAWEPTTTRVIEEGTAYAVVRIWDPREHEKWIGGPALSEALVTRDDVIKAKPEVVQRMVNAHKKALTFIRTHTGAEIADVVLKHPKTAEHFKALGRPLVVKIIDRIKPGFGEGCLSRGAYQREITMAVEYKLVKRNVTFEEFADTRFAGDCP